MPPYPERELELHKIKRSMHHDIISSFWSMLRECEEKAVNEDSAVLTKMVEGWYKQWNRMTGDDKKPQWLKEQACSEVSA